MQIIYVLTIDKRTTGSCTSEYLCIVRDYETALYISKTLNNLLPDPYYCGYQKIEI